MSTETPQPTGVNVKTDNGSETPQPGDLLPTKPPPPRKGPRGTRGDSLAKADQAWRLRTAGHAWSEIAEIVGYGDRSAAWNAVHSVYGDVPHPMRADLQTVWRERLEWLWAEAKADVEARRHGAVVAAVRVAQAAAELDGLREPTQVNVDVNAERFFANMERELISHGL